MDSRQFGTRAFWVIVALCAATVAVDPLLVKHGHYAVENWIGAHGLYGFVSCFFLVLAAKQLRRLVKRDEDFYE